MDSHASAIIFGWDPLWVSSIVFVITYAVIVTEKINRSIVALLGAGLMISLGVLNQQTAINGIDFNTLGLLTGMMVIVAISRRSGVFQFVAVWSAKKVKASPWGILFMLSLVTALFSALLDNVTTVLLIAPVTLLITGELKIHPYPFLFAEIFASNIGGTATFNWGKPATTTFDNMFTFDGVGSDGPPGWTTNSDAGTSFLIGDFSYRNGSTYNSSGISGVSLDITLLITDPITNSGGYKFDFSITNTPNNTGDSDLDGDIVTSISAFSDTVFAYDGVDYTLELLGFSNDGGVTILTDFSSPEGAIANAGVYARITSDIPARVPEPSTILLLGTGLLGLVGYNRKRFSKKS